MTILVGIWLNRADQMRRRKGQEYMLTLMTSVTHFNKCGVRVESKTVELTMNIMENNR